MGRYLKFAEMIREFDAELPELERAKAHAWIDREFNGAWTETTAEFQRLLVDRAAPDEYVADALEIYRSWCLEKYAAYRATKGLDETDAFLEAVRSGK